MGVKLRWVASLFEEHGQIGHASSKRLVFITAGISLSWSVLILSIAAAMGVGVEGALWAVTSTLAGLAGYGYVNGKKVDKLPLAAPKGPTEADPRV